MTIHPPTEYLGVPVPADIALRWRTWDAALWRQGTWRAANRRNPPDERFNVRPPADLCPEHRRLWIDYRNMRFNEETGNRWPGYDGSPFQYHGVDMNELRDHRRVEWDKKASEQMQLIERVCLSGWSPQCTPHAEQQPALRPIETVQLASDVDSAV